MCIHVYIFIFPYVLPINNWFYMTITTYFIIWLFPNRTGPNAWSVDWTGTKIRSSLENKRMEDVWYFRSCILLAVLNVYTCTIIGTWYVYNNTCELFWFYLFSPIFLLIADFITAKIKLYSWYMELSIKSVRNFLSSIKVKPVCVFSHLCKGKQR